jgi:hypothetical protein
MYPVFWYDELGERSVCPQVPTQVPHQVPQVPQVPRFRGSAVPRFRTLARRIPAHRQNVATRLHLVATLQKMAYPLRDIIVDFSIAVAREP